MKTLTQTRQLEFFAPFKYPTVTHHSKELVMRGKKPAMVDSARLKEARATIRANISKHKPDKIYKGPLVLNAIYFMPITSDIHKDGEPHLNKPDTDNLTKTLKDCMAEEGFIQNDAHTFVENCSKFWSDTPGVHISLIEHKLE